MTGEENLQLAKLNGRLTKTNRGSLDRQIPAKTIRDLEKQLASNVDIAEGKSKENFDRVFFVEGDRKSVV